MTALAADLAGLLDPVVFAGRSGFDAEPWQAELLRTQERRVLLLCSRQVGKSTVTAWRGLHVTLHEPGRLVLVIAPTLRQSVEVLKKARTSYNLLGRPLGKLTTDNESEMEFSNGSRFISLPGTEATTRGYSAARMLILDEAAQIDDDIYAAIRPCVASDGVMWALSTPWGRRGWFWQLHQDTGNGWKRHKLTVYESEQYSPDRIREIRADIPDSKFRAEYECSFDDNETQLFSTELVRAMVSSSIPPLEIQ